MPPKPIALNLEFARVFTTFENGTGEDISRVIIGSGKPLDADAVPNERMCDGHVTLKGNDDQGELVPGMPYRFFGKWDEHHKHGWQFHFRQFVKCEPHSRFGVARYLARYAPGIGSTLANRLFDLYGTDACKVLRTEPDRAAAECKGLNRERAEGAAAALREIVELEDTKIELTNLFGGRGFPGVLTDQCIKRWGILSPKRIARDPFTLLVNDMPGCGFARCDRLYLDLGLNPARMKRQAICTWHVLHSDSTGHTWFPLEVVKRGLMQHVGGTTPNVNRAVKLAIRAGWLAVKKDEAGGWWFAESQKARNERVLAQQITELSQWNKPMRTSTTTETSGPTPTESNLCLTTNDA